MRCILVFIGGLAVGILTGIGIHAAGEGDDQEARQETISGDDNEMAVQEEIQTDEGDDHDEDGIELYRSILFRKF